LVKKFVNLYKKVLREKSPKTLWTEMLETCVKEQKLQLQFYLWSSIKDEECESLLNFEDTILSAEDHTLMKKIGVKL
jgi:hypothetical protein